MDLLSPSEGILRAVLAFVFVFFLPGFAWTLVFFMGKQINTLERIALSFGLSIALVALSIFSLDRLAGIEITGGNAALIIAVLIVIPLIFCGLRTIMQRRGKQPECDSEES